VIEMINIGFIYLFIIIFFHFSVCIKFIVWFVCENCCTCKLFYLHSFVYKCLLHKTYACATLYIMKAIYTTELYSSQYTLHNSLTNGIV
jgi:hypothetical protein